MLNKDCKNKTDVNNVITKKSAPKSRVKTNNSGQKFDKPKTTAKSSKKSKTFHLMIVIWLIPVFISVYLLYLQYKQYVKNTQTRIEHSENSSGISREQIRNLRRQLNREHQRETDEIDVNIKKANIYLIRVNRTLGRAFLKPIKTDIALDRNEISSTMKKLIEYKINEKLKKKEYYSLIPNMTRILSTNINNDTVTLNFSNNFVENLNGTEQIKLKAAQIVYTATQFPGINKVKFTVNNKELKYWGGEGVFTSSVLSRLDVPRIMTIN